MEVGWFFGGVVHIVDIYQWAAKLMKVCFILVIVLCSYGSGVWVWKGLHLVQSDLYKCYGLGVQKI